MPIYCYECQECKRTIEVQQGINDDTFVNHQEISSKLEEPWCCAGLVKRIIQPCSFQLKQGGWTQKFFRTGRKGKKR